MSEALVEQALELIAKRGTLRSPAIAEALDVTIANVHELLRPAVQATRLIACAVQVVGLGEVMEYRLAVAAGGRMPEFKGTTGRPRGTPAPEKHEIPFGRPSRAPVATTTPQHQPEQPRENAEMSVAEKVIAALKAHGPMTSRQTGKHVKCSWLAVAMSQMAKRKVLKRLPGGSPRNGIYALSEKTAAGAAERPAAATGGGTPVRRKAGTARKPRRLHDLVPARSSAAGAPRNAGAFRPAITADGAILLTGAQAPGELNGAEARVLAEFLLRMNAAGVGA